MTREYFKKEGPIKFRVLLSDEDSSQIKGGYTFSLPKSFEDDYDSIEWSFPDSTEKEEGISINHTFTENGIKKVTCTCSKTEPEEVETFSIEVPVNLDLYTIDELIAADMPQGLSIVPETKLIWIDKWQEFISLLVSPPIKPVDIHNYMAYPALVNNLIAKLVVYDAFMKAAQGAMVLMMQTASGSGPEYQSKFEQMSEDSGEGHGQEKSIETGPAKVEWYDVANSIDAFFKNGAGEDGTSVFDILRRQICALATRLKIKLWMCPKEPMPTMIPRMTHVAPSFIRRRAFFVNHTGNNHKHHK